MKYQRAHGSAFIHRLPLLAALAALLLTVVLGSRGPVAAQETPGTEGREPPTLVVSGEGTVTIEPDTARVSIGVTVMDPALEAAQSEATAQMTAIIDAVTATGVAEEDVQTTRFNVEVLQEFDRDGNPIGVTGYRVSNQIDVVVRALGTLGSLLDAAVSAGANEIWGISFYVDDPSAAASQAREAAVQNARSKAEELAAAAGVEIIGLLSIREGSAPPPMPVDYEERAGAADMDLAASVPVPIEIGTTEVTVTVTLVYEIG